MKKVGVADLKNNLSRYLGYVKRGGRIVIYRRDEPVAELRAAPQAAGTDADRDRLRALERQGIVRAGSGEIPDALRAAPGGKAAGVLDALLEERATGR
jgi:antitoxin (DNA-binding transcriptional repressor) of toxin-antitoxin stability system